MYKFNVVWTRRRVLAGLIALTGCFGLGSAVVAQPAQPPATIFLMRHGEKPAPAEDTGDLAPAGYERAKLLPQLFGTTPPHNFPRPDVLFATKKAKKSNREVETLEPLSKALALPISHEVDDKDFPELAKELLSGKYAGRIVLVCWHHGSLPQFAAALGAKPPYAKWPDEQFDKVWRIDYASGTAKLTELPESLMPGDSKDR